MDDFLVFSKKIITSRYSKISIETDFAVHSMKTLRCVEENCMGQKGFFYFEIGLFCVHSWTPVVSVLSSDVLRLIDAVAHRGVIQ